MPVIIGTVIGRGDLDKLFGDYPLEYVSHKNKMIVYQLAIDTERNLRVISESTEDMARHLKEGGKEVVTTRDLDIELAVYSDNVLGENLIMKKGQPPQLKLEKIYTQF